MRTLLVLLVSLFLFTESLHAYAASTRQIIKREKLMMAAKHQQELQSDIDHAINLGRKVLAVADQNHAPAEANQPGTDDDGDTNGDFGSYGNPGGSSGEQHHHSFTRDKPPIIRN